MEWTWRDRRLLLLLATGSLIVMTGAVIAPILPEIVQQLALDRSLAGYLVSTHYLTVALFSPLLGILADRIGQIRVLVVSLILYALFGLVGGLMNDFVLLLVTRVLVGAASGGIAAASLGLVMRLYQSEEARSRAIASVVTVLTLANIIYPVLAGWIGGFHWRLAFGLYGLGFPLALLVVLILQPEKQTTTPSPQALSAITGNSHQLGQVLQNPRTLQLLFALCLTAITAYAAVIYLPLYLKATLNSGSVLNGIVLASQAIGAAAMSAFGVRRLARHLGLVLATASGFGVMAFALVLIPQLYQLHWLLLATVLFGMGLGIVMPALYNLLSNLAPSELQSSILYEIQKYLLQLG